MRALSSSAGAVALTGDGSRGDGVVGVRHVERGGDHRVVRIDVAQDDTFVVSDGSTDDTRRVALHAGATRALRPRTTSASRRLSIGWSRLRLLERYDRPASSMTTPSSPTTSCTRQPRRSGPTSSWTYVKTASTGARPTANTIISAHAFANWKYQTFIRRGQSALRVMNRISGSNSVHRPAFLREVLDPTAHTSSTPTGCLEAQRRRLAQVV